MFMLARAQIKVSVSCIGCASFCKKDAKSTRTSSRDPEQTGIENSVITTLRVSPKADDFKAIKTNEFWSSFEKHMKLKSGRFHLKARVLSKTNEMLASEAGLICVSYCRTGVAALRLLPVRDP